MPTRYLKESICTSDNLAQLTVEAERFWYRLLVKVDDYGRFDARLPVVRAGCFPLLLDRIGEEDVKRWLEELRQADLLITYMVEGRPYLEIVTFCQHNRPRAKVSKYPPPPGDADHHMQPSADASISMQLQESVTESESESESKSESKRGATPSPLSKQVEVYIDNGGGFPSGKLRDGTTKKVKACQFITENVKDDPESLIRWGRVVAGYCAQWSNKSYITMVNEYYLTGRIPGERNNGNGSKGHQQDALAALRTSESRVQRKQSDGELAAAQAEWDAVQPAPGASG